MAVEPTIKTDDLPQSPIDVSLPQNANFEQGAEVIEDGQGGAVVQELMQMATGQPNLPGMDHSANLAENMDEGYLGELSTTLRGAYE